MRAGISVSAETNRMRPMAGVCRKSCLPFGICRSGVTETLAANGNPLDFLFGGIGCKSALVAEGATVMRTEHAYNTERVKDDAADLYWLAFLLTQRQDLSIDIAADVAVSGDDASPFFAQWMRGWQRRLVIGRALAAIGDELADSARQTQLASVNGWVTTPRNWSLSPGTTKADLEQALLAIDPFPRAALLLLVFEGIQMADAATLLDADPTLIRKAQAIGLRELTSNLAGQNSLADQRGSEPVVGAPKKHHCWLRAMALCH